MSILHFDTFEKSYIPHMLQEIYINDVYGKYLRGKKDLTIIDCGGNIGVTSMYFSQFAKQVYTLEPAKVHCETFMKNMNGNNIKNVTLIQKALSHKNGTERFYHSDNQTMYSLNAAVNNKNEYEEVTTITLDTLFKEMKLNHVDLMKIDTEGAELEILCSEGFAKVSDKIDLIIGEWHSWSTGNVNIMISSLKDKGFDFNWLPGVQASVFVAKRI